MDQNSRLLYEAAIDKWGKPSQIEMLIEEMGELILALQKFKRDPSKEMAAHVCDEMADVEIMLEQNKLVFSESEVEERKAFKLDRLNTTLEKQIYGKYEMDPESLQGLSDVED